MSQERIVCDIMTRLYENIISWRHSKNNRERFTENEGIAFHVAVACHNGGFENDGNTHHPEWSKDVRRFIDIVITRHHKVFARVTTSFKDSGNLRKDNWEFLSSHDSCYKDSYESLIKECAWHCYEQAYEKTPEEHIPCYNNAFMKIDFGWNFLHTQPFKIVKVKMKKDQEQNVFLEDIEETQKEIIV